MTRASKHHPHLRLIVDNLAPELRTYAQSTFGQMSSHRMRPPLSRSNAMAKASPKRPPFFARESFLRMYPIVVPQRRANSCCSGRDSELRYSRRDSMGNEYLPVGTTESSALGNCQSDGAGYVADMRRKSEQLRRIYEIRRRRLAQLVEEYGSQAELARVLAKSNLVVLGNESYLSRMLSGKPREEGGKNIGGDTAAEIERLTKKPPGWLSRESDDELSALVESSVWSMLTPEEKLQIRGTIDAMIAGFLSDQRRRRKAG